MITDEKLVELVTRTQDVLQNGLARRSYVPEQQFLLSPVAAVILGELIREEHMRGAQVSPPRIAVGMTNTAGE